MITEELKSAIIFLVEKKLFKKERKRVLFIKVKRGQEDVCTEMIFWHPREYILFAYRFVYKDVIAENKDGSIGPFTVISNHRCDWKKKFSFIDNIENSIKWTIVEEKVLEVKELGSDYTGFYYYPFHNK